MGFSRYVSLLYLFNNWQGLVNAETVIEIFEDDDCKKSLGRVQTSLVASQGDCIAVHQGAHSVRPIHIDDSCGVTLYPDDCSGKNATLAPLETCTAMNVIETLSVDCTPLSSESSLTAKSTNYADSTKSSSRLPNLSSQATAKPQSSINRSSTFTTPTSSSTTPLILTDPRRPSAQREEPLSTTHTRQSQHTSPTSATSGGRTTDNNLSRGQQIALAVVIPAVSVIVATIFGINAWRKKLNSRSGDTSLPGSEARLTDNMTEGETRARRVAPNLPSRPQAMRPNSDMDQGW